MTLPAGIRKIERGRTLTADFKSKVFFSDKVQISVAGIRTQGLGSVVITLEHSANGITFEPQTGGGSFTMTLNSPDTELANGVLDSGIYRFSYNHSGASMTFDLTVTEHD